MAVNLGPGERLLGSILNSGGGKTYYIGKERGIVTKLVVTDILGKVVNEVPSLKLPKVSANNVLAYFKK